MFDYNKILELKEIKLEELDKQTLINWNVLNLGKDQDGLDNWICIEVWKDENDTIKILEQNDDDTEEITSKLTEEQKNHIYKLINVAMKKSA
jgi:hypothetical protein